MFKTVFFLYRRAGLSPQEFQQYSEQTHVPLVAQVPGLVRYVVNHATANPFGAEQACDGVAELWFDSQSAFEAAINSTEGQTAFADQPNYLDMARTHVLFMSERAVI